MKALISSTDPCTCPNGLLLDNGSVCELCVKIVSRPSYLDWLPEVGESDPFDELYFEELESYYEDIDYAA